VRLINKRIYIGIAKYFAFGLVSKGMTGGGQRKYSGYGDFDPGDDCNLR
jgi:hypothetical protein